MATNEPDKFDIELGTKADTSGLDQVERAIRGIDDAAGELNDNPMAMPLGDQSTAQDVAETLDEVTEATRQLTEENERLTDSVEELGEASEESDEQLKTLVNMQRAQAAAALADVLGKIGPAIRQVAADFRESDKELAETLDATAMATDSVTSALSFAAQGFAVGGPMGAAIGATIGLLSGPLKSAYGDMVNSLEAARAATDNAARAQDAYRKLLAETQAEAGRQRVSRFWQIEKDAIEQANAALDRNIALLETRRRADEQIRSANQNIAKLQGGDASAIDAGDRAGDVAAQLAEINARIAAAEGRAQLAEERARILAAEAAEVKASVYFDQAETDAALAKADQAQQSAEQARAAVDLVISQGAIEREVILAQATEQIAVAQSAVGDQVTKAAEAALQDLGRKDAEIIASGAQKFYQDLQTLLNDAVPDEQQTAQIVTALTTIRTLMGSRDQQLFDQLSELMDVVKTSDQNLRRTQAELDQLKVIVGAQR